MAAPTPLDRLRSLARAEPLPCAIVDLAAFDDNLRSLLDRAGQRKLRIASKSVRCVPLLRRALGRSGDRAGGLMTYSASETAFLADAGLDDLLLAYPTLQAGDLDELARLAVEGRRLAATVDAAPHVEAISRAAARRGAVVSVVIDADMSYRPAGGRIHVGVRRSGLRTPGSVLALARLVRDTAGVELAGLLAYEAQIAGLPDIGSAPLEGSARRLFKLLSRSDVAERRAELVAALRAGGFELAIVNGGGTGSLASTAAERVVTEVTAGSGLYCPHLFDGYDGLGLVPAAFFALQVVRASDPAFVTCHGGGYVASGQAGADRLPVPVCPGGLSLLRHEGAGEVQTPLRVARGAAAPAIGDAVLFRHAKAGELCERFDRLLLVEEGRVVDRVPTYRGDGKTFA